ncbi:MAG: amidohydrolase, partial [Gammaproteobacteria bacterium]|nr:amidohydrolase [Gammaproteobacteria bacterium]
MKRILALVAVGICLPAGIALAQDEAIEVEGPPPELSGLKAEAAEIVGDNQKLTQEIVDSLFSFSELGFQEFETQRYLTELLESNGFT